MDPNQKCLESIIVRFIFVQSIKSLEKRVKALYLSLDLLSYVSCSIYVFHHSMQLRYMLVMVFVVDLNSLIKKSVSQVRCFCLSGNNSMALFFFTFSPFIFSFGLCLRCFFSYFILEWCQKLLFSLVFINVFCLYFRACIREIVWSIF